MNIYFFAAFALRLKQVTKRVVLWVTFCWHILGPAVPLEKRVACKLIQVVLIVTFVQMVSLTSLIIGVVPSQMTVPPSVGLEGGH